MDFPIVVLISGRGSNMLNLADTARHFTIAAVVSNKAEAPGLAAAARRGIKTISVSRTDFESVAAHKKGIFDAVQKLNPKLVVLAGYMKLIDPYFIEAFPGRIVNIHPALLPKYPGLDTHRRALEARETEHGCSVHVVDSGIDTGPIIAQARVPVNPGDAERDLEERVLTREHVIYPWVVNNIAAGKITVSGRKVQYAPEIEAEASKLQFILPPH